MDINAIKEEIQKHEEQVRASLEYIEYLKSLLENAEQVQETTSKVTNVPDTQYLYPHL
jgi:hypothetical protein